METLELCRPEEGSHLTLMMVSGGCWQSLVISRGTLFPRVIFKVGGLGVSRHFECENLTGDSRLESSTIEARKDMYLKPHTRNWASLVLQCCKQSGFGCGGLAWIRIVGHYSGWLLLS